MIYASYHPPWLRTHADPQPDSLWMERFLGLCSSVSCGTAVACAQASAPSPAETVGWEPMIQMAVVVNGGGGVCGVSVCVCVCVCLLVDSAGGVCVCVC